MICEYFAGAVDAVQRVEHEPYCVSSSRLEVRKILVLHSVIILNYC